MTVMTEDQFKEALPAGLRKNVNQEVLDLINNSLADFEMVEQFRDNLLGYHSVLTQGKYKMTSYVDAIRYVTFKLSGFNNKEAYAKAFPHKMLKFQAQSVPDSHIASYISAYANSKLVVAILAQSIIPTSILNADVYQEAINIQLMLARTATSEKVRSDAANSLLVQLRPPEAKKVELSVTDRGTSEVLVALREASVALANQQRDAIAAGVFSAKSIAESSIIEGEVIND